MDAYVTAHFKHNADLLGEPVENQITDLHAVTFFRS
jgi:hypothetical protein